jgi:nucleoside-diphosphate-sugar epimerase
MSPVLVTGGSGYLGTQLIAALLGTGVGCVRRFAPWIARAMCVRRCVAAMQMTTGWRSSPPS